MPSDSWQFDHSWLLGDRAQNVYSWFLESLHLSGDVAECGVFTGETSRELVKYLEEHRIPKTVHLFDGFEGLPNVITDEEAFMAVGDQLRQGHFCSTMESVVENMGSLRQYVIHPGLFSETFAGFKSPLSFIHADADLYESTVDIIRLADRCLVPGGHIVFDDYDNRFFPGVSLAIERNLDPHRYAIEPCPATIQCFATKL
jgi:O-methyltransferase